MAIDSLLQGREGLSCEMESIDQALLALGYDGLHEKKVKPRIGNGSTRDPKRKLQAKKPSCTKQEVIDIVAGLLRDNGNLSKIDLEDLAKEKLKNDLQRDLKGFAMRFKEALSDAQFAEFESGKFRMATA
ncbi:MAG: hypothetical protein KDA57_10430 [Planctomycetales bacterium]|nr:hypothetical protein [Planctomycetales bacterium]